MAKSRMETEDSLREIRGRLYCVDGILHYKKKTQRRCVGDVAGFPEENGYEAVMLLGKKYLVHKIIYYLHHDIWPDYIDHINGVKNDNRIENLRVSSPKHNSRSARSPTKGATSVYRGVSVNRRRSKWAAMIRVNSKNKFLGYFTCEKEAARAYNKAAIKVGYSKEALNEVD